MGIAQAAGLTATAALAAGGALASWSALVAARTNMLVPADGAFIELDGARIHYVDKGEGPTLLAIHGLLAQLRSFSYLLAERMTRDHRVIMIDRPGWGHSRIKTARRPGLLAQADIVADFIARMRLDRPLLVGHSLGGSLALALALRHPDAIGGIALIAPFTQPVDDVPAPFKGLIVPPALLPLFAWTLAVPAGMAMGLRRMQQVFAPDPVPADYATRGGGILSLKPQSFASAAFELSIARDEMMQIATQYASLRVPTAILYGRSDNILDPMLHGVSTAASIPGADITLLDGGHMLPVTKPAQTEVWLRAVAHRFEGGAARR